MPRKDTLHGILRGADAVTQSRIFEGRFGRMFRDLPPAEFGNNEQENLDVLKKLGAMMISNAKDIKETEPNPEEATIPAGYTFLGQFIDHDITFDPVSSLQRDNDLNAMVDYRTPRFDLDSVYGRGPDDQPYLYRDDGYHPGGVRMVLGRELTGSTTDKRPRDVPRNLPINQQAREAVRQQDPTKITVTGLDQVTVNLNTLAPTEERAIIGDPRNDENVILAQLHAIFLRFHNRITEGQKTADFTEAQRIVRWHYQWVILHDFLPRIVGRQLYSEYLPYIKPKSASAFLNRPELPFYRPKNEAYIPVEFSAAAYRFGHSMVRRTYRLNRGRKQIGGPIPIMGRGDKLFDLRGFRFFQTDWAIDWDLFFDGISPKAKQKRLTPNRVQPALKIDTALVQPLAEMPFEFTRDLPSLPQRNLIRGWRLGLPSGEAIAHAMGIKPISDPKLKTVDKYGKAELTSIGKLPEFSNAFRNNTPLWFYILAEAQEQSQGEHLGQVGGRIVMETFVGLMLEDHHSFLRQEPQWKPETVRDGGTFHMADFISEASQA